MWPDLDAQLNVGALICFAWLPNAERLPAPSHKWVPDLAAMLGVLSLAPFSGSQTGVNTWKGTSLAWTQEPGVVVIYCLKVSLAAECWNVLMW